MVKLSRRVQCSGVGTSILPMRSNQQTGKSFQEKHFPANKLRSNYIIFRHSLVTNKLNEKMTIL